MQPVSYTHLIAILTGCLKKYLDNFSKERKEDRERARLREEALLALNHEMLYRNNKMCIRDRYLRKGNLTGVCGRCQTRTYESKDGTNRFVMEVVAEEVSFLTPKKEQTQSIDEISEQYGFIEDDDMPF